MQDTENILMQVRNCSITAKDALKKLIPTLVQNALFGYVSDWEGKEEYIDGLNWNAIDNYLKDIDWYAVDMYGEGCKLVSIKQHWDLARNNARWVAIEAIKDFLKKIKTCPQEEIENQQGYCCTGVFEAFVYAEEGLVILEINFKPRGVMSSYSIEDEE